MSEFSLTSWQQLTPRTWRLVAEPDTVTIGLIVGDDGCLLVDCGSTPEQGRQIRESISQVTDRRLRGVMVTHGHRDHWFGLAAFDDVDSWGFEGLDELRTDPRTLADAAALGLDADDLRTPKHPVSLVVGVDLGNQWVELVHVGPGHSPSDMLVVVGAEQVVFTGDVVEGTPDSQGRPAPEYGPDSDAERWPIAVDAIVTAMQRPGWQSVPGHGPQLSKDDIAWQRGLHTVVHGEIQRLGRLGVTLEEAAEQGHWPWDFDRVRAGVQAGLGGVAPQPRQLPLL